MPVWGTNQYAANVTLSSSDGAMATLDSWVRIYTPMERVYRAGLLMIVCIGLAASLIPIPIIHLLGIPLVLITGLVLALKQLRAVARLRPLQIHCPKCDAVNRVGGGIGMRSLAQPTEWTCEGCRRVLTLRVEPVFGD